MPQGGLQAIVWRQEEPMGKNHTRNEKNGQVKSNNQTHPHSTPYSPFPENIVSCIYKRIQRQPSCPSLRKVYRLQHRQPHETASSLPSRVGCALRPRHEKVHYSLVQVQDRRRALLLYIWQTATHESGHKQPRAKRGEQIVGVPVAIGVCSIEP